MTAVPLPDTSCVRIRTIGGIATPPEWGQRFYVAYSGSAPTPANCVTLATLVATAWNTNIASLVADGYALNEVDVLDITTDAGNSGIWSGSHNGTRGTAAVPIQCALGIEYNISRRYRGGKPRTYLVAGLSTDVIHPGQWDPTFTAEAATAWAAFIGAIEAADIGSMGSLSHINLSYYQGFTNFTQPSGREKAVPKYRATAKSDTITGYSVKLTLNSQRRRRNSTSP